MCRYSTDKIHGSSRKSGDLFFSNEGNKAQFILLLSRYLESDAQTVHNSIGDADTMIISCALQMGTEGSKEVIVVADDTNMLILLMHHWTENMADVYFLSEPKKSQNKGMQVWRICDLIAKAGTLVTSHFCLFMHGVAAIPPVQLSGREKQTS